MNVLSTHLDQYMAFREARGLQPSPKTRRMLQQFTASLPQARSGNAAFTQADVLTWVNTPTGAAPAWRSARLSKVRQFAIYLAGCGVSVQVPATRLVPSGRARAVPYIYTPSDIQLLMQAAGHLHRPLRAATMSVLIGLLTVTGMRIGEALSLDVGDVDHARATVLIRNAKLGRQRLVTLDATTCRALTDYLHFPQRTAFGLGAQSPLLTSTIGTRLSIGTVYDAWARILDRAQLPARPGARPRLHDLRHTFATRTMITAYQQGRDPAATLAALAIWLGHSSPAFTYWYLQSVPELATVAIARLDATEGQDQ